MKNIFREWNKVRLKSKGQKLCCVHNEVIPYSLLIPYSLFLISFDGFQLNLENTSTTENASRLLIFKFRGRGHGDILSLCCVNKAVKEIKNITGTLAF
jgi:hypothetical protein